MPDIYDCAIVGDGPAGLSAAVNLMQRGRTCVVLGLGNSLLARAELVNNYLGLPAMSGRAMADAFTAHARQMGAEIRHAKVSNIMPLGETLMINADGDILSARTVLLAMGAAKADPVPGEAEYLGRGVSYCATCDGMLYREKNVLVWALGTDAWQEAGYLASIGCHVTAVAPKAPQQVPDGIRFVQGTVRRVLGEGTVTGAEVLGADKAAQTLPADGVFILRDAVSPAALLSGLAVQDGFIVADKNGRTNIPGVYAAGDVSDKPLQVAKAVGDGQKAALYIASQLEAVQG